MPAPPGRSFGQIVIANTFTIVNAIIFTLFVLVVISGNPKDGLFVGVVIANSVIGVAQEVRSRRELHRLEVITEPRANVVRSGRSVDIATGGDRHRRRRGASSRRSGGRRRARVGVDRAPSRRVDAHRRVASRRESGRRRGAIGELRRRGQRSLHRHGDRCRQLRQPPGHRGQALRAGAVAAARGRRPDPALAHVGDPGCDPLLVPEPSCERGRLAGRASRHGCSLGGDGARWAGAVDQPGVHGRRDRARPPQCTRQAALDGRGAGASRRAVSGQDRNDHDRQHRVRRAASGADPVRGGGDRGVASVGGGRHGAQCDHGGDRCRSRYRNHLGGRSRRAVRQRAEVVGRLVRRSWLVLPRRPRLPAACRRSGCERWSRRSASRVNDCWPS